MSVSFNPDRFPPETEQDIWMTDMFREDLVDACQNGPEERLDVVIRPAVDAIMNSGTKEEPWRLAMNSLNRFANILIQQGELNSTTHRAAIIQSAAIARQEVEALAIQGVNV